MWCPVAEVASALLAVYTVTWSIRVWRNIMCPSPACTPTRAHRTVVLDFLVKIFTRGRANGQIRSSNGRCGRAFGKTAEALENLGMSCSMFNAAKHLVVLGLIFSTAEGLFSFESVKCVGRYARQSGEGRRGCLGWQWNGWTGTPWGIMYWAGVGFLIITVCSAPGLLFSNSLGESKVLLIPTICKGQRRLAFLAGPARGRWAMIITVYPRMAGEFV